jgi:phage FluMu protein Com
MSIEFHCEHCNKLIKAPDESGGKRGKCPYCNQSNYIPAPLDEDDVLDLEPEDTEYERRRQEEIRKLREQEKELIAERDDSGPPLEQRSDVQPEDLHHFVVNYVLDMSNSQLERAEQHVRNLRKHGSLGVDAVDDFIKGKVDEPALGDVPDRLREGFLKQLREQVAS